MHPWEALACKRLCPLRFFACIRTAVRKWELFLFSQRFAEGFANLPNAWILMNSFYFLNDLRRDLQICQMRGYL